MGMVLGQLDFKSNHHYSIAVKTFLFEGNKRKYIVRKNNKYIILNLNDDEDKKNFRFKPSDINIDINEINKLILIVSKIVEGRISNFTEEDINKELYIRRKEVELALSHFNLFLE